MKTHEKRGGGKGRDKNRPSRRRRRWLWKYEKRHPRENRPQFGICQRCGKDFTPDWMERLGKFGYCCDRCQVKNLSDALQIPWLREATGIPLDEP